MGAMHRGFQWSLTLKAGVHPNASRYFRLKYSNYCINFLDCAPNWGVTLTGQRIVV